MTFNEIKAYNAEHYPASALSYINSACERVFNQMSQELNKANESTAHSKLSFNKTNELHRTKD